jgi:hypothetical protein
MNHSITMRCAGLLALLGSSTAFGATVTFSVTETSGTANDGIVNVGDSFSILMSGADFPETGGFTLLLNYDGAVATLAEPSATSGIVVPVTSPFAAGALAFDPFAPGDQFTVLAPLTGTAPSGTFDAVVFNFTATGLGALDFSIGDDGIDNVWTDANTIVTVQAAVEANIAVSDSVAPADDLEVPFGDITQGQTSTQTVTVTNAGGADLVLGAIAGPATPFSLANDLCSGQTLAPTDDCTFDVQFQPAATGLVSDTLDIPSNDPDTATVTVDLNGTGTPAPGSNIVVTDSVAPADDLEVPFGDITQGQTGTQTVTITNTGDADLVLGTVTGLAAPFTVANDNCSGQTLTPATPCTLDVQFQPDATGLVSGTLDIPSNDPDTATVSVAVNGTGVPVPAPNIGVTDSVAPTDDLSVPFGSTTVGGSSSQTITVTNSGDADLVLGTVTGLAAPFAIASDNCSGQTVTAMGTCTFQVEFSPIAAGVFNDGLDIPSNDADTATVTVSISGTGASSMGPAISVSDSVSPADDLQVDFGDVFLTATANQTVTVTNDGSADLVLGTIGAVNPLDAPFSILPVADTCSARTLEPAESCTFIVEFATDVPEIYNDSFDIPSNDPDEPSITVAVSATGQQIAKGGSSAVDFWSLALLAGLPLIRRRRS